MLIVVSAQNNEFELSGQLNKETTPTFLPTSLIQNYTRCIKRFGNNVESVVRDTFSNLIYLRTYFFADDITSGESALKIDIFGTKLV